MNIINIENSPLRNRRFRIYLLNGEYYDVGYKKCKYYIDTGNKEYRNFFYSILDARTKNYIMTMKPSQILYETFILNGGSTDIIKNINFFNKEILQKF
jgi:hypothetical protein